MRVITWYDLRHVDKVGIVSECKHDGHCEDCIPNAIMSSSYLVLNEKEAEGLKLDGEHTISENTGFNRHDPVFRLVEDASVCGFGINRGHSVQVDSSGQTEYVELVRNNK
tara:strand:- start:193 stop:522 length:330 start_codon:yes stop_codon:yes gene_type:complete